jgi:isopentenyldiphosphate isomerase
MSEKITLFIENDNDPICVERDDFYNNRRTTYEKHFLYIVDVLLFNSHGEILLQKRSRRKKKMP